MSNFLFWKGWSVADKILYAFALIVLLCCTAWFGAAWYLDRDLVIGWEKTGEVQAVPFVLDTFIKNFFSFTTQANSYMVVEKFSATGLNISPALHHLYLVLLLFGSFLLLSAASRMSHVFYFVVLSVLSLQWAAMGLEGLEVFPQYTDRLLPLLVIGVYGIASAIFHFTSFKPALLVQVMAYGAIAAGFGWLIQTQSAVLQPFMQLSSNGYAVPLVLGLFFVLLTAQEYIRVFVFLTTYRTFNPGPGSIRRLMFISALYFANLFYAYFFLSYIIDLDIFFLHPLVLFIIAALLGITGFRQREPQYKGIMDFEPAGALVYAGLGIIAISNIAFAMTNANDPLIEVYEDIVLVSYLGFGAGFLFYVYLNFKELIQDGQPAWKVLYRPLKADYSYVVFIAVVIVGAFLANNSFFTYRQAFAGYFNRLGDLYYFNALEQPAKENYNVATGYDPANHRSYYSLGVMAEEVKEYGAASVFYNKAISKRPSPYAFERLSSLQQRNGNTFDAIFTLQEGLKYFSENGQLQNNVALLFNQAGLADSALVYFEKARGNSDNPGVIQANILAFLTEYRRHTSTDSVYGGLEPEPYIGTLVNELAFMNQNDIKSPQDFQSALVNDSLMNTHQLCYIYNYALNQLPDPGEAVLQELKELVNINGSYDFKPFLQYALANHYYRQGRVGRAIGLLQEVNAMSSSFVPDFVHLLGLWFYEMEEYEKAAGYFAEAVTRGYADDKLNQALALSELPEKAPAIALWQGLQQALEQEQRQVATEMLQLLVPDSLDQQRMAASEFTDAFRFRYLHYNQQRLADQAFKEVYAMLADNLLRVVALSERVMWLATAGEASRAGEFLALMPSNQLNEEAMPFFGQAWLRYANLQQQFDADFLARVEATPFPRTLAGWKPFYLGNYHAARADSATATTCFTEAIALDPYEATFYLRFAEFYQQLKDADRAYQVLLEGTRDNPGNPAILQAYVLASLELGYTSFAEDGMAQLENVLPPAPYQQFKKVYSQKLAQVENLYQDW